MINILLKANPIGIILTVISWIFEFFSPTTLEDDDVLDSPLSNISYRK